MLGSMGSDILKTGWGLTTQNRSLGVLGSGAVKSVEHLKTFGATFLSSRCSSLWASLRSWRSWASCWRVAENRNGLRSKSVEQRRTGTTSVTAFWQLFLLNAETSPRENAGALLTSGMARAGADAGILILNRGMKEAAGAFPGRSELWGGRLLWLREQQSLARQEHLLQLAEQTVRMQRESGLGCACDWASAASLWSYEKPPRTQAAGQSCASHRDAR